MKNKIWKILSIIIGFPILYILFGKTSIAIELFVNKDLDYYIPFWGGIIVLHWLSVLVVIKFLKSQKKRLVDIGYKLSNKGTLHLVGGYLLVAILMLVGVEILLNNVELDPSKFGDISGLIPKTTSHRIFFILLVFSTGFCEEIVYRGFAITQLNEIGLNKWIALIVAAFIFIGIHGINAYTNRFFFLFGGGIMFGVTFLLSKRLLYSIIIHLIINLTAMMAILQLIK
ncbi:CPBP family intramembrane glutamic endopeptidase [Winogradskyella sp. UBA3174]|uniref:CPBP family intramembrane glutamic endopeptidase n=1 Tax=Winogradskyella sp. UBA3174 TaxID=1947785 RepID=UPI0025D21989|nr:type II CAAX endopeptidase family protein [Winogradskyella sp. UBA3174]